MPNRTSGKPGRFRHGKRHTPVPGKKERETKVETEERERERRMPVVAPCGHRRVVEAIAVRFA